MFSDEEIDRVMSLGIEEGDVINADNVDHVISCLHDSGVMDYRVSLVRAHDSSDFLIILDMGHGVRLVSGYVEGKDLFPPVSLTRDAVFHLLMTMLRFVTEMRLSYRERKESASVPSTWQ
jgi:hypothetical protein